MVPKERIFQLLCVQKGPWMQKDVAEYAGCSRAYVSRVMKGLLEEGVISRPYKNQVTLLSFSKVLMKWAAMRKMPEPVFIESALTKEEIEKKLAGSGGYALTLFSGAWHHTKFMKTGKVELYADKDFDVGRFGRVSAEPANMVCYRSAEEFDGADKVGGLLLVHPAQNYVDLASTGGVGMRAADEIAKKYGWL